MARTNPEYYSNHPLPVDPEVLGQRQLEVNRSTGEMFFVYPPHAVKAPRLRQISRNLIQSFGNIHQSRQGSIQLSQRSRQELLKKQDLEGGGIFVPARYKTPKEVLRRRREALKLAETEVRLSMTYGHEFTNIYHSQDSFSIGRWIFDKVKSFLFDDGDPKKKKKFREAW